MSVFFAYPALLWGLLAGAIPLLIHLLRRRRAPVQELPTMRFLVESHKRQLINIRLQDLMLLIVRTLLILLLVLALAGPQVVLSSQHSGVLRWLGSGGAQRVLLIDTSRSMSYNEASGTRLQLAQQAAKSLLDEFPLLVETLVIGFSDGRPEEERAIPASFSRDRVYAKQQLELLQAGSGPSRASWGLRRATELLAQAADGAIFYFTDLQQSSWEDLLAAESSPGWLRYPISVIDVSQTPSRNVWFDRVTIPALPVGRGEAAFLQLEIASQGFPKESNLPVSVSLSDIVEGTPGSLPQVERDVLLQPGENLRLTLPFSSTRAGRFQAELEMSPLGFKDPLMADNRVPLEIPVVDELRVLILMESLASSGQSERSEHSEETFLRSCLQLALETPGVGESAPFMRTEFLSPGSAEPVSLEPYSVIIVYGPPALTGEWQSHLLQYVREGGGLLLFLDSAWPKSDFTSDLKGAATGIASSSPWQWMRDAALTMTPIANLGDSANLQLTALEHPSIVSFGPTGQRLFSSVRVWRAYSVQATRGETLAELRIASGTSEVFHSAVVQERRLDSGRLIAFGVPLQRSASNLGTSAAWVPTLQQLVKYLATPKAQLPSSQVRELYPHESDLTKLTTAEQQDLSAKMPISFNPAGRLAQALARGQGSRDLTSLLLLLTILLGVAEVMVANRMR